MGTRVNTRAWPEHPDLVPAYIPEYGQNIQIWYPGTYPSMTKTIRLGTRVSQSTYEQRFEAYLCRGEVSTYSTAVICAVMIHRGRTVDSSFGLAEIVLKRKQLFFFNDGVFSWRGLVFVVLTKRTSPYRKPILFKCRVILAIVWLAYFSSMAPFGYKGLVGGWVSGSASRATVLCTLCRLSTPCPSRLPFFFFRPKGAFDAF